jgi:hypothetical protein
MSSGAPFSDQTSDVTYERGQGDPIVRLRQSHPKESQEWFIRLDVDLPPTPAKQ